MLDPIESIQLKDAIIDLSDPERPKEPAWPSADFIVGNPPFLGGNKIRAELGDPYVDLLFALYDGRVPAFSDLCCYWFEKARFQIQHGNGGRAGLLATQGIRGRANRRVLERIKETGDIFFAESDRDWILDGATVHVSMVGFDKSVEHRRQLDGTVVATINANLTSAADTTAARKMGDSLNICFMGPSKKASFDISDQQAISFLLAPNPDGRPNSNVVRPWSNALDVTRRPRCMWIIDFGNDMVASEAARYEQPFEYVAKVVKPERVGRRESRIEENWWRFGRPRVELRRALVGLPRFIATPAVAKHRLFAWCPDTLVPDQQLLVFAKSDACFFGILQSRAHEVWARAQGTQVRERESGFRYTPTTCFETFAQPAPSKTQAMEIAAAADELDRLRNGWLNPPEWTREEVLTFPGSLDGPWARYVENPNSRGIGTVHYRRLVPLDAGCAKELAKRTLTNLYNQRPAWLANAHRRLDEAVFAAYGWPPDLTDDEILARLLELNLAICPAHGRDQSNAAAK